MLLREKVITPYGKEYSYDMAQLKRALASIAHHLCDYGFFVHFFASLWIFPITLVPLVWIYEPMKTVYTYRYLFKSLRLPNFKPKLKTRQASEREKRGALLPFLNQL